MATNTTPSSGNFTLPLDAATAKPIALFILRQCGIEPNKIVNDDVAKTLEITFDTNQRTKRAAQIGELRNELEKLYGNRYTRITIKFA